MALEVSLDYRASWNLDSRVLSLAWSDNRVARATAIKVTYSQQEITPIIVSADVSILNIV